MSLTIVIRMKILKVMPLPALVIVKKMAKKKAKRFLLLLMVTRMMAKKQKKLKIPQVKVRRVKMVADNCLNTLRMN